MEATELLLVQSWSKAVPRGAAQSNGNGQQGLAEAFVALVFNGKTSCSPGTQHLELENRKNFSVENVVKSWHRLSRAVLEAPVLEGFKRRVDVGLEDVA